MRLRAAPFPASREKTTTMRQIVLDTETTGLETRDGHRIIEIGAVELVDRRLTGNNFHHYIDPQRDIDVGALEVHGLSREFLSDKPPFAEVADEFDRYAEGAELIIHNAPFDLGFLDHEYAMLPGQPARWSERFTVIDTLLLARDLHSLSLWQLQEWLGQLATVPEANDPGLPAWEQRVSAGCTAFAIELAAEALGYAGVWRTGSYAEDKQLVRDLGGADNEEIVAFLYLGTRDGEAKPLPVLEPSDFHRSW